MWVLLVIVGMAGVVGYFMLKKPKVIEEVEAPPAPPTFSDIVEDIAGGISSYSVGEVLTHNETGQRVKILKVPSIINGEYTIEWPSGATGEIHEAQLRSWFTRV